MIQRACLWLCLLLVSFSAHADFLKTEADAKQLADKVMTLAGKGDLSAAFQLMKPYVAVSESEFEGLSLQSRAQREQFGFRYGKSIGHEFLGEKKVGQSLLRLTYIEKTEKHAMPWMFVFYRTPEGWTLNAFVWHDKVQTLFD